MAKQPKLTKEYKGYKLAYEKIINNILKNGYCTLTEEDLYVENLPDLNDLKIEYIDITKVS